jgi:hypothetical protein
MDKIINSSNINLEGNVVNKESDNKESDKINPNELAYKNNDEIKTSILPLPTNIPYETIDINTNSNLPQIKPSTTAVLQRLRQKSADAAAAASITKTLINDADMRKSYKKMELQVFSIKY